MGWQGLNVSPMSTDQHEKRLFLPGLTSILALTYGDGLDLKQHNTLRATKRNCRVIRRHLSLFNDK